MQLGLTIPLQKYLRLRISPCMQPQELAYCWDLHLVHRDGKEGLIMINASSRFEIYLHDMRQSDWQRLPELAREHIARAFIAEELPRSWVKRYLLAAGPPELTGTHGRRAVGALNHVVEMLMYCTVSSNERRLEQPEIDWLLNETPGCAAGFSEPGRPRAFLRADFERLFKGM